MRVHKGFLEKGAWIVLGGLLVTRPARIASDLLSSDDGADPEAVAEVIADALRGVFEYPPDTASSPPPSLGATRAAGRGDGISALAGCLTWSGIHRRSYG